MVLGTLLSRLVLPGSGTLSVTWPDGRQRVFGSGEPKCGIALKGRWTPLRLALHPDLTFGECYMDGSLVVTEGDMVDVVKILMTGSQNAKLPRVLQFVRLFRRLKRRIVQFNPARISRKNVAHHYDLSGALYDLFLDTDRQYSCAYFPSGRETLEEAQVAKKRHIAAKLYMNRPGLRVLDIGSGWGGLGLDLARDTQADVLGVTLSKEQLGVARDRAQKAGLSSTCKFELRDYRAIQETFDRIVSVGMFEHVGVGYYDAFFHKVRDLLTDDGVMLLHYIGRSDGPGATNPWTVKYIFPGGYCPSLSEVVPCIERAGLMITDIEVLRLHYAETLKEWRARFRRNWAKAAALYDERFCRMWDFYLIGAEMCFRCENMVIHQIQIAKRQTALPLTRDYMLEAERAMRYVGPDRVLRPVEAAE
jgi:cyclopropane-fatty-acyl-phospholipid synthase